MLVRNSGAAVGYLLCACRYARDPLHGKELGDGLRNTENMRKELTLFLRRLRRHLLPVEGGSGTPSCSSGDTKDKYVTLGSFLRKELGEALRIGPRKFWAHCQWARFPPTGIP